MCIDILYTSSHTYPLNFSEFSEGKSTWYWIKFQVWKSKGKDHICKVEFERFRGIGKFSWFIKQIIHFESYRYAITGLQFYLIFFSDTKMSVWKKSIKKYCFKEWYGILYHSLNSNNSIFKKWRKRTWIIIACNFFTMKKKVACSNMLLSWKIFGNISLKW